MHRLAQWSTIQRNLPKLDAARFYEEPLEGQITLKSLEILFHVLAENQGLDQECFCGFWEGYGNLDDHRSTVTFETFPGIQKHLLFKSTLRKILNCYTQIFSTTEFEEIANMCGYTPNAIWPISKEWYLAIPYNRMSSYLGGAEIVVSALSRTNDLETYEAFANDNIWYGMTLGDKLLDNEQF